MQALGFAASDREILSQFVILGFGVLPRELQLYADETLLTISGRRTTLDMATQGDIPRPRSALPVQVQEQVRVVRRRGNGLRGCLEHHDL